MSAKVAQITKKSGRPARLSRQQILDTALSLLKKGEHNNFSIRKIAQQLGTSPSNLYTYFPDKQSLLNALGEHVFASIQFAVDDSLAWDQQITQWLEQVHEQLLSSQDVIFLMGVAGTSPQSLSIIQAIAQLLESLNISKTQSVLHAQSLLWTVMSFTLFEVQASDEKVTTQLLAAIDDAQELEVTKHMAIKNLTPLWKVNLQRNIDGLRFQITEAKL